MREDADVCHELFLAVQVRVAQVVELQRVGQGDGQAVRRDGRDRGRLVLGAVAWVADPQYLLRVGQEDLGADLPAAD